MACEATPITCLFRKTHLPLNPADDSFHPSSRILSPVNNVRGHNFGGGTMTPGSKYISTMGASDFFAERNCSSLVSPSLNSKQVDQP